MFAKLSPGIRVWSWSLTVLLLAAAPAFAQFDTGTVVGTVRDASGAAIPGAKVTLTNVETGVSIVKTAGDDGNYEIASVKPGQYVVTGEKPDSLLRWWTTCGCRWRRDCGSICSCPSGR